MKKEFFTRMLILYALYSGGAAFAQEAALSEQQAAMPSKNLIANSGFELDKYYNGSRVRNPGLILVPTDSWYTPAKENKSENISVSTSEFHSGKKSLKIEGNGATAVYSSPTRKMVAPSVTLSVYVKTTGASGDILLQAGLDDFKPGWGFLAQTEVKVKFPENSGWTKLTVSTKLTEAKNLRCGIVLKSGTVYVDDVQIELSAEATDYNVRPEELFRLSIPDFDNAVLPTWKNGDASNRILLINNDSRVPIEKGDVTVFMGPWNNPVERKITSFKASEIKPGSSQKITFNTADLPNDAYVLSLRYSIGNDLLIDGAKDFKNNGEAVLSRSVMRFAMASGEPLKLFGVGNGMISNNRYTYAGLLTEHLKAKKIGVICSRGGGGEAFSGDYSYATAAGGMPYHHMDTYIDRINEKDCPFANPVNPGFVDLFHPDGEKYLVENAEKKGKEFGSNLVVASYQMANETVYLSGVSSPSKFADDNFRSWCQKRYKTLGVLNEAWGTKYTDWNEIEQIVSAKYIEEEKAKDRSTGYDWQASTGGYSKQVLERMKANPGRAMDWLRWRTEKTLEFYNKYRDHARKYDNKTLYSTNLCWPNFWPQMFMPFIRSMDVTMLDASYTSGFFRSLGNATEMMDIMEMAESSDRSKPVWGIEIYLQPTFPPEFAAMQNWGMLAHGMTNNLVFAWNPFSDSGIPKGNRAWEEKNAPPMWMLFDNDGSPLPALEHYERSFNEIKKFHERFDGLSIKRVPTDVALYVSNDSNEYVIMETGNKPWSSSFQQIRMILIFLMRMNGITADYIDDSTLPDKIGTFKTIIIPTSPIISQEAAHKIADFAKSGGTVVICGMSGMQDQWLKKYDNIGGAAWADLEWKAPDYSMTGMLPVAFGGEASSFRGINFGTMRDAEPLLDDNKRAIGWTRKWGNGKLIAYGIMPPMNTPPHFPASPYYWIQDMVRKAGVKPTGRWIPEKPLKTQKGGLGSGNPLVEVVVRVKANGDKFVFCLNQGGFGKGKIEIPVDSKKVFVEDVIQGKAVEGTVKENGIFEMPMDLNPWEYRVLRITKNSNSSALKSSDRIAGFSGK